MKNQMSFFEYLFWLCVESFACLFLVQLFMKIVPKWTPETILVISITFLSFIYIILKVLSLIFKDRIYVSMLPISYLLGFYSIQFLMLYKDFTDKINYTPQLTLLTLFFIITTIIDRVGDNYSKHSI